MRSKDTIFIFGNWRIDLIKENRSLQLVGMVTEGKGAFFSLQCYAEGDQLTIYVPTFDSDEIAAARRKGFVQVTVWNDQSAPTTVPMLSFKGAAGIAIADKRKLPDPFTISAFDFLGKLREARIFFALEAGGLTRTYDAKHLNVARGKFEQSCTDIRKDWAEFVSRL